MCLCVCVSLCVLLFVNVQRSVSSTPLFCVYEGFMGKVAYVFALKKQTNTVCVFLPRVHKHTNLTCTHTNTQKSQSERDDHRVTQRQYCWQGLQWGLLQTHSGWPKSPHTARVISCLCACHFHPLAHSGYRYGDPSECPETSRSSRHLQSANTKGVKVKKRSNILTWQLLMHF